MAPFSLSQAQHLRAEPVSKPFGVCPMTSVEREVKAKEIVQDIRSGMTTAELMKKYRLSKKGLRSAFRKLRNAGVINRQDILRAYLGQHTTRVVRDLRRFPRKRKQRKGARISKRPRLMTGICDGTILGHRAVRPCTTGCRLVSARAARENSMSSDSLLFKEGRA